jgi:ABC-type multidrug transport system ATPase subunit
VFTLQAMRIILDNAGKRFNRDSIFKKLNYEFHSGKSYAVIGPNGSGKSTLMQVLSGNMNLSEGKCSWMIDETKTVESDLIYKHVAIAAPYLETIEEMTAEEFLQFHFKFKPIISSVSVDDIIEMIGLEKNAHKQIRLFSSGMKQRIKLAQAIFADTSILLLDEPCTNLDIEGYELYKQLIKKYCSEKLVIVSSNDLNEYDFCDEKINILDYK